MIYSLLSSCIIASHFSLVGYPSAFSRLNRDIAAFLSPVRHTLADTMEGPTSFTTSIAFPFKHLKDLRACDSFASAASSSERIIFSIICSDTASPVPGPTYPTCLHTSSNRSLGDDVTLVPPPVVYAPPDVTPPIVTAPTCNSSGSCL